MAKLAPKDLSTIIPFDPKTVLFSLLLSSIEVLQHICSVVHGRRSVYESWHKYRCGRQSSFMPFCALAFVGAMRNDRCYMPV